MQQQQAFIKKTITLIIQTSVGDPPPNSALGFVGEIREIIK
jgi:hypothetical protein